MTENTKPQTRLITVADGRLNPMLPEAKVLLSQMISNVEEELSQFRKEE